MVHLVSVLAGDAVGGACALVIGFALDQSTSLLVPRPPHIHPPDRGMLLHALEEKEQV